MATNDWSTKPHHVASLHLDAKNPRLGRETTARAPREIIQYLFEHDKAMEVAQSIATRGYFPNEPLLAIKMNGQLVIVEGNRRLAALKALREPGLVEAVCTGRLSGFPVKLRILTISLGSPSPSPRAVERPTGCLPGDI